MFDAEKNELNLKILKNINLSSEIHKQHKINILKHLINQNKDLAPQGSQEWLEIRKYTIGGSEISTITGDNCFSKLDNLVAQKIGFSKFSGNIACKWGKLFEGVTQQITKRILNIEHIYETGSLEGAIKNQRYSPDGLGVVKILCESKIGNEIIQTDEYCIVLFEYKSPYSSIPMGIIPTHYLPQVKTGLCSIPITDFAIFINNLYRKCAIGDLNETLVYDTVFHSRDSKFVPEKVLALGINIFYQTPKQMELFMETYVLDSNKDPIKSVDETESDETDSDDDSKNVFNGINTHIYKTAYDSTPAIYKYIEKVASGEQVSGRDFGKGGYGDFNSLLELYDKGLVSVHYCEPHICESYYDNIFLSSQNKKPEILDNLSESIVRYRKEIDSFPNKIGYLPWKLLKSDILYQERDPNYLNKYTNEINKTLNIIEDINDSHTEFEKIKKFKKYFPKSKILKDNGLSKSDAFEFLPRNI